MVTICVVVLIACFLIWVVTRFWRALLEWIAWSSALLVCVAILKWSWSVVFS